MPQSLTDKTISGLNWNFIRNYSTAISTIIIGIILGRLLSPQDFGIIGMVTVFIGFADLFATLGMGQSIIRIKDITQNHIRVANTITITASIAIYFLFYFSAELIADFYNEQNLILIIRVLSFLFIIKGINTVSYGLLTKKLDFKTITYIQIFSNVAYGLTSTVLAFLGFGVWSLVWGKMVSSLVAMILTTRKYPIDFRPLIRREEFRELAGFGTGVSLSNIFYYASTNIDLLIIGKLTNPASLGLYTRAINLMSNALDRISGGMSTVLFPIFAQVQDQNDKLRIAYFRAIRTSTFFLFPILISLIISGEYIIKGLYGAKWGGAVLAFQILAFGGILRSTLVFSGTLAQSTGRIFYEAGQQLIYFLIIGIGSYIGIQSGIQGVAIAVVIALLWLFIAQTWLALNIIEGSWKEFLASLKPAIFNLSVILLVNLLLVYILENYTKISSYELKLIITVFVNVIIFCSLILFLPISIKGDTVSWIIQKYENFIPAKLLNLYFQFNKHN